jgi:hypothetical protein
MRPERAAVSSCLGVAHGERLRSRRAISDVRDSQRLESLRKRRIAFFHCISSGPSVKASRGYFRSPVSSLIQYAPFHTSMPGLAVIGRQSPVSPACPPKLAPQTSPSAARPLKASPAATVLSSCLRNRHNRDGCGSMEWNGMQGHRQSVRIATEEAAFLVLLVIVIVLSYISSIISAFRPTRHACFSTPSQNPILQAIQCAKVKRGIGALSHRREEEVGVSKTTKLQNHGKPERPRPARMLETQTDPSLPELP